jgi:hypothetical protein
MVSRIPVNFPIGRGIYLDLPLHDRDAEYRHSVTDDAATSKMSVDAPSG